MKKWPWWMLCLATIAAQLLYGVVSPLLVNDSAALRAVGLVVGLVAIVGFYYSSTLLFAPWYDRLLEWWSKRRAQTRP